PARQKMLPMVRTLGAWAASLQCRQPRHDTQNGTARILWTRGNPTGVAHRHDMLSDLKVQARIGGGHLAGELGIGFRWPVEQFSFRDLENARESRSSPGRQACLATLPAIERLLAHKCLGGAQTRRKAVQTEAATLSPIA